MSDLETSVQENEEKSAGAITAGNKEKHKPVVGKSKSKPEPETVVKPESKQKQDFAFSVKSGHTIDPDFKSSFVHAGLNLTKGTLF